MVKHANHLGFIKRFSELRNNIFIPKYYNPEVDELLERLAEDYTLITIGELVAQEKLAFGTGHEIGKMAYGTGQIPFVRTSDIANWEIKADPKQGVSQEIYEEYALRQDVQAGDVMMVRDGTYLIGQSCMVTEGDLPCLYQSHVLKFRVKNDDDFNRYLFFAGINSPIAQLQIKARKFTADIIDTLGGRFLEIAIPVPKTNEGRADITARTKKIVEGRAQLRTSIKRLPLDAEGRTMEQEKKLLSEEREGLRGFVMNASEIRRQIYLPKYYNVKLTKQLSEMKTTHRLVTLQDLVEDGTISWETGIEVGKMAYGTGNIPFLRTSDISNWELKRDPKQGVSQAIYDANLQDVKAHDIFLVRDGTYLVGTSCMVSKYDEKSLFCGGLYKFRVNDAEAMNPYLFLALLNAPVVRRQMKARQFTRDIIDTLGKRIFEVSLPIPKNKNAQQQIIAEVQKVVDGRADLRAKAAATVEYRLLTAA